MDILARRYRKSPDLVHRRIADEYVLVPVRSNVADMEAVYALGGVGTLVWELLDGERDGQSILAQIVAEYDIAPDEARRDLVDFLQQLEAIRGIIPVEG